MGNRKPSALLSLLGVMLLWPYVLSRSVSSKEHTVDRASLSAGQGEERPHVVKRSTESCEKTFDSYCLNNGQCVFLVDIKENHCKCELGFHGTRCEQIQFVFKPVGEEQWAVTIVCVTLLIIGLTGILYFCCKWYKKSRFPRQQKHQGYKGVQTAQSVPQSSSAPNNVSWISNRHGMPQRFELPSTARDQHKEIELYQKKKLCLRCDCYGSSNVSAPVTLVFDKDNSATQ